MSEITVHRDHDAEARDDTALQHARTDHNDRDRYVDGVSPIHRVTDTPVPATLSTGLDAESAPFTSAHSHPGTITTSDQSSDTARTDGITGHHSPSPYRPGPTSMRGPLPWGEVPHIQGTTQETTHFNENTGYPRSTTSDPLPRTSRPGRAGIAPTMVGAPGDIASRAPQFSSLEGLIPPEQLNHLRVLGVQYGLQAAKLKTVSENLGALSTQTMDIREQTNSTISRIQRSISDNNRFLMEGNHYLSEITAVFDDPVTLSSVSTPAAAGRLSRRPIYPDSDDDTQFD